MKKKILALCLVVVLAVTAVTGATLAYFTDTTDDVVNTFTVGEIGLKLDEEVVQRNEDDYEGTGKRTEDGNKYDEIYPGAVLPKDPTVTVLKDSEDCYVRMHVTVNVDALKKAFPATVTEEQAKEGMVAYPQMYAENGVFLLQNLVSGWDNTVWVPVTTGIATAGNATYDFWYNGEKAENYVVPENETDATVLEDLFTHINVPGDMNNEQIAALENLTITVTADAIQSAGFANATAAWAAFDA